MSSNNEHIDFKTPYLDKLKGINSFKVPKGYFKELEEVVNVKNNIQGLENNKGLGVPEGYFDKLVINVKNRIAEEEIGLEELALTDSFVVPTRYFETLEDKVKAKINLNGKVIQLFSFKSFAYAASIAALIAVSIFVFDGNEIKQDEPLVASNINFSEFDINYSSYKELKANAFFEEITESDFPMDGIVFGDINIDNTEVQEEIVEIIEEEEIFLDATEFIELDSDELDLFDY